MANDNHTSTPYDVEELSPQTVHETLESVLSANIDRLVELRDRAPGFIVLDDDTLAELITESQSLEAKASSLIWYAQVEQIRERAAARDAEAEAPYVGAEYERFLPLLACAGSRDRFHALDVRRHQGVEAAVRYLERCNITPEHDQPVVNELEAEGRRIYAMHSLASTINEIVSNISVPGSDREQISKSELSDLIGLAMAADLLSEQLANKVGGADDDTPDEQPEPAEDTPADDDSDDEPGDTPELAAYRRGHRDGLWHAENAVSEVVKLLHPNDKPGVLPPDMTEPLHEQ